MKKGIDLIAEERQRQVNNDNVSGECNDTALEEQLKIWFEKGKCSGIDDVIFHPQKYGLEKQGQKSTWSEEDEEHLNSIISDIKTDMGAYPRSQEVIDIYNDDISFLKSLKERVQPQPKQEWSEEDEKMVKDIIAAIDTLYYHGMVNWLKSLKDRIQPQPKQEWDGTEIAPPIDSDVCG